MNSKQQFSLKYIVRDPRNAFVSWISAQRSCRPTWAPTSMNDLRVKTQASFISKKIIACYFNAINPFHAQFL